MACCAFFCGEKTTDLSPSSTQPMAVGCVRRGNPVAMGDEPLMVAAADAPPAMPGARCEPARGRMSGKTSNPDATVLFSALRDTFDYQWEMMNGPDRHQ
jgi:hypothetical protein